MRVVYLALEKTKGEKMKQRNRIRVEKETMTDLLMFIILAVTILLLSFIILK